jgi:hypothetical protein
MEDIVMLNAPASFAAHGLRTHMETQSQRQTILDSLSTALDALHVGNATLTSSQNVSSLQQTQNGFDNLVLCLVSFHVTQNQSQASFKTDVAMADSKMETQTSTSSTLCHMGLDPAQTTLPLSNDTMSR